MSFFKHPSACVLLLGLFLIAACQPVPRPFASDDPATRHPLSAPRAQAGVLVRAVAGAPHPMRLARAVSKALGHHDVIAATGFANRASWLLTARASTTPPKGKNAQARLTIQWFLTDPQGRAMGQHRQVLSVAPTAWQNGDPGLIRTVAEAAAAALAPLAADPYAPVAPPGTLTVHEVVGAPGDGDISLRRALVFAMRKRGFRLTEGITDDAIVISGTVRVRSAGPAGDDVAITWTALAPDGALLGNIKQRNRVPAGSLGGPWGLAAIHVAEAAAPGLARLLARSAARGMKTAGGIP